VQNLLVFIQKTQPFYSFLSKKHHKFTHFSTSNLQVRSDLLPNEPPTLSPIAAVWMPLTHSLAAFREDFPPSIIVMGKDIAPLKTHRSFTNQ
jgi:hypothetical protein